MRGKYYLWLDQKRSKAAEFNSLQEAIQGAKHYTADLHYCVMQGYLNNGIQLHA